MASDHEMRGADVADGEPPDDMVAGWLGIDPSDLPVWPRQDRAHRAERAAQVELLEWDVGTPLPPVARDPAARVSCDPGADPQLAGAT